MIYDKLFKLLLKRDIPGTVLRLLFDTYKRQYSYLRWNNFLSTRIPMQNGVKQGRVLSPTLFCIYFDELLRRLAKYGIGCYVGHLSYAAIGYADDMILLSPSIHGLEDFVKICEQFAIECGVTFNANKTQCICFDRHDNVEQRQICVNGQQIMWVDKIKYLGNVLTTDLTDTADVVYKRG